MPHKYESGPPKSGKTERLIKLANQLQRKGQKVTFITCEHFPDTLRLRGLHEGVGVQVVAYSRDLPVEKTECVKWTE